jgi:hypothetical protein
VAFNTRTLGQVDQQKMVDTFTCTELVYESEAELVTGRLDICTRVTISKRSTNCWIKEKS